MSNFSFSFFQDLCSLKFLKSSDLQKTSLCPPQRRPLEIQQNDPDLESNYSKKESGESKSITRAPSKKGTGTPTQGDVEKVSVTEKDFRIMQVLKSGTNFRTYMVKKESDDALYAMKLMGRRKMEKKCFNEQVKTEKEIMEKAKTPFIPRLLWYFENDKKIFFVMDYVEGETLSQMLQKLSRFSEEMTRFFAAEVLLTLEYLHKELGVSYGNLKLENILLDAQGHIKVLDFTQAKSFVSQEAEETSQSNCSETHKETGSQEMEDFVALGHLIYKLLTGKSLTVAEESEEAAEITSPKFSPRSKLSWPSSISKTAKDLISRLINKDNEEKPSINTIAEIKQHAFFSQVNWEKMSTLSVYPPLIPSHHKENNKDLDDFDDEIEASLPKLSTKTSLMRPSLGGSSEDFDAISYDRATCMNSLLGYR